MLLEMDQQHPGLISLNMSPFHLSPQGSPQGAGGAPQQSQQQQQQNQYSPSPYGNCAQSPASNMCHPQQSQQQQQQSHGHLGQNSQAQSAGSTQNQQQQSGTGAGGMSGFEAAFFEATSLDERCPMCGYKFSGYQYGLLNCDSCKNFFKRTSSPNCSSKKVYTSLFSPTGGGGGGNNGGGATAASGPGSNGSSNGSQSAAAAAGCAGSGLDSAPGYASNQSGSASNGQSQPQQQQQSQAQQQPSASSNVPGSMCHPGLAGQVGVGVVTGSIPGPSDFPDTKDVIEELCPVCGDKVSGYHYGLLTCESCKGFFKRTVQNKKVYTCVAERQCHIDKTQRKRCPFCRFQKCLEVGMKLEAVRADRMRGGRNKFGPMYKRDRARKLQMMRQRQIALQNLRGSLGDPTSYPATVAPLFHIKQEIQIPQVSSLTSSPDSSPSPAAVAAGLVTTQAGSVSSAHQLIAPSTQASLSSATSNSGHLHGPGGAGSAGAGGCANPLDGSKLWPANSTTPSPKAGFGGAFEHHHGPASHSHQAELSGAHQEPGGPPGAATDGQRDDHPLLHSKASPLIQEFVQTIDDREWQASLFGLLQNQTYNQCEVDLFELMCKVLDQNLFSQVDWARNSVFFKDLKVDDQMKLLQHSWSDMLVLDHVHQRMHNRLPDETTLHNGQKFDLLCLGLLGVPSILEVFRNICVNLTHLKFDLGDYICMKFLLLLNHDVRGLVNRKHVQEGHEQVKQALLEYTLTCYPHIPNKFSRLLEVFREIHLVASKGEEHLYAKHCSGSAPTQTLLMEMLHAKRK